MVVVHGSFPLLQNNQVLRPVLLHPLGSKQVSDAQNGTNAEQKIQPPGFEPETTAWKAVVIPFHHDCFERLIRQGRNEKKRTARGLRMFSRTILLTPPDAA